MTAARKDFTIEQGKTWVREIAWRDSAGDLIDTSGYTARMHVRKTTAEASPLIEFTTDNSRISLGIATGGDGQYNVQLFLSATDSSALDINARIWKGVYDLELSGGGVVTGVLKGDITIEPEVTRE